MVVDIGGGTTDVAVISLGGIVRSTSIKHAGNSIDLAIAEHIKKTRSLNIGDKTAERIKIHIGSALAFEPEDELVGIVKGRDTVSGLPRSVELKTNEIVAAIGRETKAIIQAIKDVLQETPPELAADIMEYGIILTGGSAQLRGLAELIIRRINVKAVAAKDPTLCVVRGLGVALDHFDSYKKSISTK
jgi:rod shape-determining protein MreB